jgi:phage tail sheath protein FI
MTQNDIDNGRAVVEILIAPTLPVETIRVVLSLDEGGQLEVLAAPREEAA